MLIPQWQPLVPADLDLVNAMADRVHTSLPERPEVFAEKARLYPQGCRKLLLGERMVGYGISHPWLLDSIPPLDEFLVSLPQKADCIYLHDIVVLPEARGRSAAKLFIDELKQLAAREGVRSLALVSVYGTDVLWSRLGFHVRRHPDLDRKLTTYGPSAKYMVCHLDD